MDTINLKCSIVAAGVQVNIKFPSLVENKPKVHPKRYQHEEDPVLMLTLVPGLLYVGNFGVDVSLRRSFSTGW